MNFYQQIKRSDIKQKRVSGFLAHEKEEPDSVGNSPSSSRFVTAPSAVMVHEPRAGGDSPSIQGSFSKLARRDSLSSTQPEVLIPGRQSSIESSVARREDLEKSPNLLRDR